MKKYNLSKIYDDSFKKDILNIIKQGMPEGAIYSSSEKPPEGAQVYRTDRGTEYWIPSKKDEPTTKKPTSKKTRKPIGPKLSNFYRNRLTDLIRNHSAELEDLNRRKEQAKGTNKVADLKTKIQFHEERKRGYEKILYGKTKEEKLQDKKEAQRHFGKIIDAEAKKYFRSLREQEEGVEDKFSDDKWDEALEGQAKPKVPKTGSEQFTDKQRKKLAKETTDSWNNLSDNATDLYLSSNHIKSSPRQRPIRANLIKKMENGTYDRAEAEKVAKNIMDDIAKNYQTDSGQRFSTYGKPRVFVASENEKREAAAHWVKHFEHLYALGSYDDAEDGIPKQYTDPRSDPSRR